MSQTTGPNVRNREQGLVPFWGGEHAAVAILQNEGMHFEIFGQLFFLAARLPRPAFKKRNHAVIKMKVKEMNVR